MVIYLLEAIIKSFSFGIEKYLENSWNMFDLFLASTSLVNTLIKNVIAPASDA